MGALDACDALQQGDAARLGALMTASHDSLRDDYEVSCPELDLLVELFNAHDGCHGARLTGAGFGGCMIALVERVTARGVTDDVLRHYAEQFNAPMQSVESTAGDGARGGQITD